MYLAATFEGKIHLSLAVCFPSERWHAHFRIGQSLTSVGENANRRQALGKSGEVGSLERPLFKVFKLYGGKHPRLSLAAGCGETLLLMLNGG